MSSQLDYYNQFGENYRDAILNCPEPEKWTTDYTTKGRIYQEISERLLKQEQMADKYFISNQPVLDIGCGFGRQSFRLAKKGYAVTGIDSSKAFIDIASELFSRNKLAGKFICRELNEQEPGSFPQVVLFDVLEHIQPASRRNFLATIAHACKPGGILLISLPHLKKRLLSLLNNSIRKSFTQHLSFFLAREEHPYPVPGKNAVLRLIDPYFTVLEFQETPTTDYYACRRK